MQGNVATDADLQRRYLELAVSDFDEAIRLDPGASNPRNNRGAAHFFLGHDDQALADLTEAIRLAPGDAEPLATRCLVRLRRAAWQAAWADCDAAVRLQPTNSFALYGRGRAAARLGRSDGTADMARAEAIEPRLAAMFTALGITP